MIYQMKKQSIMSNDSNITFCTTCGQVIKEVVIIGGKPYGTTCAERIIGIDRFPSWFTGGDWDTAKKRHEVNMQLNRDIHSKTVELTKKYWGEYYIICKAHNMAIDKGNQWAIGFINSIADWLGYQCFPFVDKFETFEKAFQNWNDNYMGSFPYLTSEPKSISCLSDKQRNILNKYL